MQYVMKIDNEFYNSLRMQGIEEQDIEPVIIRLKNDITRDKDFQYGEFIYVFENSSKNYGICGSINEKNTINITMITNVI